MSDSRYSKPIPVSPDEYKSKLIRGIQSRATSHHASIEIVRAMPAKALVYFQALDYKAELLHTKIAVALKCCNVEEAATLLHLLPPIRLVRVNFDINEQKRGLNRIWPVTFEPRAWVIHSRTDLAPFLYTVTQGASYGPIHELSWVTRLSDRVICILTQIEDGPGEFELIKRTFTPPGRAGEDRFKWERRSGQFPKGPCFGNWGAWANNTPPDVRCTVYWPLSILGYTQEGQYRVSVAQRPSEDMARVLLNPERPAETEVAHET